MAYQETKKQSYGGKVKSIFGGILGSLALIVAATVLLWWNEGRAVRTADMLDEAGSETVSVESVASIDPSLNGKLIHATANAETADTVRDGMFGIAANAISLARTVEYYQYVQNSKSETKEKLGGGTETVTTYTYEPKWVNKPVSSSDFKDPEYRTKNYVLTQIEPNTEYAQNVNFGAYHLPDFMVKSIGGEEPIDVSVAPEAAEIMNENAAKLMVEHEDLPLTERYAKYHKKYGIRGQSILTGNDVYYDRSENVNRIYKNDSILDQSSIDFVHSNGNVIYIGKSETSPHVGDVRVTFTQVAPKEISIIAQAKDNTFTKYVAKNGETYFNVSTGAKSAAEIIATGKSSNTFVTWALRLLGFILVCAGLRGVFKFIPTLLSVVPFLASIVSAGIGLICFIVGLVWSLVVIALAWLYYRPILSISLLAVAAGCIWYLLKRVKDKKAAASAVQAATE